MIPDQQQLEHEPLKYCSICVQLRYNLNYFFENVDKDIAAPATTGTQ